MFGIFFLPLYINVTFENTRRSNTRYTTIKYNKAFYFYCSKAVSCFGCFMTSLFYGFISNYMSETPYHKDELFILRGYKFNDIFWSILLLHLKSSQNPAKSKIPGYFMSVIFFQSVDKTPLSLCISENYLLKEGKCFIFKLFFFYRKNIINIINIQHTICCFQNHSTASFVY